MLEIPGTTLPDWAAPLRTGGSVVLANLPNAAYHATYALVSKSALDEAARSMAHYEYLVTTGHRSGADEELSESAQQARDKEKRIGSAFHSIVLEPDNFDRDFIELPDFGNMQSSKNRALRDAWLANEAPGKTPLKPDWVALVRAMRESLYRHKRLRRIFENGRPEVTCAALDPHTGLPRKVRIDWLCELEGIAIDLKSARDAAPPRWRREAGERRYHVQDTYYTDTAQLCGLDVQDFGFAVVEKTPPYVPVLFGVNDTARLAGEVTYLRELAAIAQCIANGRFPGYGDDAIELDLPPWYVADAATVT